MDLFIDARNTLYRAIYAVRSDVYKKNKPHYMAVFLRQIANWIQIIKPTSVHIFWDAPRATIWRRQILSTYKDRTDNQYVEELSVALRDTTDIAKEMFKYLNVRQYDKPKMEADDLIYAATVVCHPKPSVIVSSDSDMTQIPYYYSSSSIYHPSDATMLDRVTVNPVLMKSIVGDSSDCIKGYYGIGPVKGKILVESLTELQSFLVAKGDDVFYRNMLLIDLQACPWLVANRKYVTKIMASPVEFDTKKLQAIVLKHKLAGFMTGFNSLVMPFKDLK